MASAQRPPAGPQGQPGPFPALQPGQQPTPEQIRQMQAQLAAEAQKAGMTVPQYVERLKAQAMQQHQMRAQMAQQQQQQQQQQAAQQQGGQAVSQGSEAGQQVPITAGPPKPEALAVAKFLRSQDLKMRTCILAEKRREMFKVKRAMRALQSPAYEKARKKNPLLPAVTDRVSAENTFKMLPLSMLALRVSKVDPHEGHDHPGKKKRVKGLWTVKIEQQQEANDEFYYAWLWEGSQWKTKLMAVGALLLILAVVFFPLWPFYMRLGVWYLSMAMLGLLGLFFAMAIFRLILFVSTVFTVPPGLWLYPNLFEDVGFFDSFKPAWAWHEDEKTIKKRKKDERERKKTRRAEKEARANGTAVDNKPSENAAEPAASGKSKKIKGGNAPVSDPVTASTTGSDSGLAAQSRPAQQRIMSATVEEADD